MKMRMKILLSLFIGIFLLQFFIFSSFYSNVVCNGFLADIIEGVLVGLVNMERSGVDVDELQVNPLLEQAAQLKAQDMAQKGYFAHTSPEGITPWYWFGEVGYSFSFAGENLAVNFTDSNVLHQAWLNSFGHRKNILNENFTEIGIGKAEGIYKGKQATFVVQLFGKPKGTPVERIVLQDIEVGVKSETIDDANLILGQESEVQEIELHVIQETDLFVSVKESSVEDIPDRNKQIGVCAPRRSLN